MCIAIKNSIIEISLTSILLVNMEFIYIDDSINFRGYYLKYFLGEKKGIIKL